MHVILLFVYHIIYTCQKNICEEHVQSGTQLYDRGSQGNVGEMWDECRSYSLESLSWTMNCTLDLEVLIFIDVCCWRRRRRHSSSAGISFYSWSAVFISKFERIKCCNISVPSLFSLALFKKCRSVVYVGTHLYLKKFPKNKHHVCN